MIPAGISAIQNTPKPEPRVEDVSLKFLKSSPTFLFDGITDSIKIVDIQVLESYPIQYRVVIEFDCNHGGYGDRSDATVTQAITKHVIKVTVVDEKITSAVIDEKYDEMSQSMLPSPHTPEEATTMALEWLYLCPTFKFDGVLETVKILNVDTLRMPNAYAVYIEFISQYPGYGDRTGRAMLGHSQQHTIKITVVEGKVMGAVIDEIWDEMNQRSLQEAMPPLVMPISTEEARDVAIKYIIDNYGLNFPLPTSWEYNDLTPKDLVGATTIQFVGEGWVVTMKFAVVMHPTYTIDVEYMGKDGSGFNWSGTVDSTGKVVESSSSLASSQVDDGGSQAFGVEDARNMVIQYIMENHSDLNVASPSEWAEKNLNEGLLGYSKIEYSSGCWTIIVEGPVVWKPDYNVQATYKGSVTFTWKGLVPNGGPVQELGIQK
jgi:hypothetical protein